MSLDSQGSSDPRVAGRPHRPLLSINGLTVSYLLGSRHAEVIRDIDLEIHPGEKFGVVGESGSGKTTLALAILGYLGEGGRIDRGSILLDGQELSGIGRGELRKLWGRKMAYVPQDPFASLNPSLRIEDQICELLQPQLGQTAPDARVRAGQLLESVHITDPERVLRSYSHQISGGMRQRVLIAMALSAEPLLLILDEPTTGLDATTQAGVIALIRELVHSRRTAVLYVSHNLGVVGSLCDRVAVLYAGELLETAPASDLFVRPLHPYTSGLLGSIPRLGANARVERFTTLEGRIPPLGERPSGCVFEPRCPLAISECSTRPELYQSGELRTSRCYRWEELSTGEAGIWMQPESHIRAARKTGTGEILALENLSVRFQVGRTPGEFILRKPQRQVLAVEDLTLALLRGSTLGLVGESGAGKTSLARAIAGLVETVGGGMELAGVPLPPHLDDRGLETLKKLQMVFQNPDEALNPYLRVGESLRRPLMTLLGKSREEADRIVPGLLESVRLPATYQDRLPSQLSGGEKQRVAIARAFASHPDLLLFDEPVSSLDVSVQASILNLLLDLQDRDQTTQIFITHDLAVVSAIADRIAVIYSGRLMEVSPSDKMFSPPYHPYTETLLAAIPRLGRKAVGIDAPVEGESRPPPPEPSGCPYRFRCPRSLGAVCAGQEPPWQVSDSGKQIYCHIPLVDLEMIQRGLPPAGEEWSV